MGNSKEATEPIPKAMTVGRKVFDYLAIITLVVFVLFTFGITIGTILIPSLRGE